MQKYILNKSIEGDNIKDLEGVGEAAWGFISALYESHWDHLIADKNNFSFRRKVKAQFNPQIDRDITSKKVVEISKYFKKNSDNKGKNHMLKHHLLTPILPGKPLKSRKHSPIFRTRKLRIFRKSSAVKASLN